MEISEKPPLLVVPANAPVKEGAHGAKASTSEAPRTERDTVQLSVNASEIREMVSRADSLPDVRADKVAELKRRIASGTYQINTDQVASQLIGESVENNTILHSIDKHDD